MVQKKKVGTEPSVWCNVIRGLGVIPVMTEIYQRVALCQTRESTDSTEPQVGTQFETFSYVEPS